jgi:hypothetical protein
LAEIWRTHDYRGRVVAYTSKGRDHILQRRPKMAGRLGEMRTAIERPTLVTRDAFYSRRECHYLRTVAEPGWMKVVVTYRPTPPQGTWVGEIITAYPIRRPEPEEMPLWP